MFGWLTKLFRPSKPTPERKRNYRLALYDAAQDSTHSEKHWQHVDGLSAKSANSPGVRKTLREKARYESANNCRLRGLALTLANETVGTGPRLQVVLENREHARQVEAAWNAWAKEIRLAEKLRTARQSKLIDGEAFFLLRTNEGLTHPVKLDIQPIEADQVATPMTLGESGNSVDGIVFDQWGNPSEYHLLKEHPGDLWNFALEYERIPARSIIHMFRCDRPGQRRGIPEVTPALGLYADAREYRRAILAKEKIKACFTILLQTKAPPDENAATFPFDIQELDIGTMTTLPDGCEVKQLESSDDAVTFESHDKYNTCEAAYGSAQVPRNVALGDSSSFNYSSARLDNLWFRGSIDVERSYVVEVALDPLFAAFIDEAVMIPGLLPAGLQIADLPHNWYWPAQAYIDPAKEATADTERLNNHTVTLASICASQGQDWEEVLEQRGKEMARMKELGLDMATAPSGRPVTQGSSQETQNEQQSDDETAAIASAAR